MKTLNQFHHRRFARPRAVATGLLACVALGALLGTSSYGGDMYHPNGLFAGGVRAQSTVSMTNLTATNVTVCGYGMQGWYDIQMSSNMNDWVTAAHQYATEHSWCIGASNVLGSPMAFIRLGQSNSYVGQSGCSGCHGDKFTEWQTTKHSRAYEDLVSGFNLPMCFDCHTVGRGQPTGYTSASATPNLTEVGCETCHGPAGWHRYSDHDLIHPAVSIDPQICGGCHTDSHHPTYDEYATTLHAQVNDDVKYGNNTGVFFPGTLAFNQPVFTNVLGVVISNYYGYYVTTNADSTLKTNANSGIISSFNVPGGAVDPGQDRQASCGVCHSGATRSALLEDFEARQKGYVNPLNLPTANDSGSWGPTCAVCHDPHEDYNTAQLRNPTRSTNYYTMATVSDRRIVNGTVQYYGTTFGSLYDPNIQACGQCHNTRGARWDGLAYGLLTNTVVGPTATNTVYVDVYTNIITTNVLANGLTVYLTNSYIIGRTATNLVVTPTNTVIAVGLTTNVTGYSRPPHFSPQYNMLIGILQPDYLTTNALGVATNFQATHSGFRGTPYNTNQCATCHMPSYAVNADTNVTGHTFQLNTLGCALGGCHLNGVPDVGSTQTNTANNISRIVDLLNQWATYYSSNSIGGSAYSNSLLNSWEFTLPGILASVTNAGPSSTNQKKLPAAIRQARFNTYMVASDGSMGVHNPGYEQFLLRDAESKVLSQFNVASFKANSPSVWTNVNVTFTNLNPAATTCIWDFGDSTPTVNSLGPVAHAYANVGNYNVTLTTTDPTGTKSLTRNNYIITYAKPTPSFITDVTTGPVPLTVNFTNTSANATYYRWSYVYTMNGVTNSPSPFSNLANPPPYVYTNAATYQVRMTAYNPGGNVSILKTITATPPGPVTAGP